MKNSTSNKKVTVRRGQNWTINNRGKILTYTVLRTSPSKGVAFVKEMTSGAEREINLSSFGTRYKLAQAAA